MTESTMFDQPAPAGSFPLNEHLGHLLLIWPTELKKDIATTFGASDAIACRIAVVDGHDAGEEFENVLLFPRVLVSTLTSSIGKTNPVLGRLGQGTAKQGQSKPWVLDSFTDADAAKAVAYLNTQFSGTAQTPPAASAAAPAAAPAAPAAAAPATPAPAAEAAPAAGLSQAQLDLATSLAATPGIPRETVAQAVGTTVEYLVALEILPPA